MWSRLAMSGSVAFGLAIGAAAGQPARQGSAQSTVAARPTVQRSPTNAAAYEFSISVAARSGIRISWWPTSEKPRPLVAVGRATTFVWGR